MDARYIILRIWVLLLLAFTSSCGTRSIVVPVTRPALIDLHSCERIVLPPVHVSTVNNQIAKLLGEKLDAVLVHILAAQDGPAFLKLPQSNAMPLITQRGTVALSTAKELAVLGQARCVLYCEITEATYHEEILQAAMQSSKDPVSVKRIRQGRSSATCRILVIDIVQETVTFADTLRTTAAHETHAVDQDPPALRREDFLEDMARRLAEDIAAASRPFDDREVVTFLVDDAYPEIDTAIVHAERGLWQKAASLLYDLTQRTNVSENVDILWYDLGLVLQYQQDFKGALDAFENAVAIRDCSRYRRAVESLLQLEGRYLESIRQHR
jgi:tetratricopeptide (TPR) repeat protein